MTRTPPDMETAMSETHTFPSEEIERMEQCYELLSALGDPVVAAEALPELVEVAQRLTSRTVHPKTGRRIILEADIEQLETLLAKLKARP